MAANMFAPISVQGYCSTHFNGQSIEFPLILEHGKYTAKVNAVLDTGSDDIFIPAAIGSKLHLANLSGLTFTGTSGRGNGYYSQVSFVLGKRLYQNYSCQVAGNLSVVLFGAKFFRENRLSVFINFANNSFTIGS